MEQDRSIRGILVVALLLIVIGGTVDIILDRPASWFSFHVLFELILITGGLVMTTALWLGWWRARNEARALSVSLEQRKAERDTWMVRAQKSLDGLSSAIDGQFEEWHLTPAEREVALLLLKGYSHKHAAAETGRSERTVRQHATVVYQKAGLGSRAELAAFFLDALRLP